MSQYLGVDVHFSALLEAPHLSGQPDGTCCFRFVPALAPSTVRRPSPKPTPSRHRFEKPIHNVKKLTAVAAILLARSRSRVFIIRILVSAVHPLRRQSQQSCALWRASQRWPPWTACDLASLNRLAVCGMVEPIGIEPMT